MANKRFLVLGAIALIIVALVIAFGLKGSGKPKADTLSLLGEDASTMQALETVKSGFESTNGVKVTLTKNAFEILQQKANADLSSGSGLYDVILNVNSSLATYVHNHWVYTLSDLVRIDPTLADPAFQKDLFQATWHEVGFYPTEPGAKAEAIGYPWAANTMLLVYNKRLFEDPANKEAFRKKYQKDLAPPTQWQDYQQVAEFFTKPSIGQYGTVLEGASGGWLYYEWVNFAYSMGGGVMKKSYGWEGDASTPLILDSPETIAATKFYVGLKPYSAGDFLSTGQNEEVEMMRKGNVAMAIIWSDTLFPMIHSPGGDQFGFAPIPGDESQIGGGIFYVNRKSNHPKLAAKFLKFYFQPDTQKELILHGVCSPVRSVYDDPGVASQIPYAHALQQSLDRGVYMTEAGPDSDAVQEEVTTAIQKIWRGQSSVEDGLHSAQLSLQKKRQLIFAATK